MTEGWHVCIYISVVIIHNFVMRYVSQHLGHDAIRITILVYRISQCLDLQFFYDGNAIYIVLGTLYSVTTIGAECAGRWPLPSYWKNCSVMTQLPWSPYFDVDSSRCTPCNIYLQTWTLFSTWPSNRSQILHACADRLSHLKKIK